MSRLTVTGLVERAERRETLGHVPCVLVVLACEGDPWPFEAQFKFETHHDADAFAKKLPAKTWVEIHAEWLRMRTDHSYVAWVLSKPTLGRINAN